MSLIFCMDIGGTRTKYGLFHLETGQLLSSHVEPTRTSGLSAFIMTVKQTFDRLSAQFPHEQIRGAGIGVPGYVDGDLISMVWPSLAFIEGNHFRAALEETLGFPVRFENDARAVALGEAFYGGHPQASRLLSLTLGTGLGFGMVIEGQLLEHGSLNHLAGHIPIRLGTRPCFCGFSGCLESLTCAQALEENFQALQAIAAPAPAIFTLASQQDPLALQAIQTLLADLSAGLNAYIHLFAPALIVLGGGLAQDLLPWLASLQQSLFAHPYAGYTVQLALSKRKEEAGLYGAASLWKDSSRAL